MFEKPMTESRSVRVTEQKAFVRDPRASVSDPNYIPNAVESIDYFDQRMRDFSRITRQELENISKEMHKVAAYGKNGDRIYNGATGKKVKPGTFWEHDGLQNSRPSRKYAQEVSDGLKLRLNLQDGPVQIKGLPAKACPLNYRGIHVYPSSQYFHLYFDRGSELLRSLSGMRPGSPAALRTIAEYYHTMANARPFNTINNSLFFNQTNYLLRRFGFDVVPQGYLDHLAHALQPDDFARVFQEYVKGRVPPPSAGIISRF
jgi:hypothetical protein